MVRLLIATVFTAAVSSLFFCQAGSRLSVRLLDAKNGKPLKGVAVFLMIRNENGKSLSPSRATTNAEGIAFLNLPEPAPENIELSYSSDAATPKAGEVVVFGHRISLWERIRREIP